MGIKVITAPMFWEIRKLGKEYSAKYEVIGTWLEDGVRMTSGERYAYCATMREARSISKALRRDFGDTVRYTKVTY